MSDVPTVPLSFERADPAAMRETSRRVLEALRARRSVRDFSPDPVPLDVVRAAIEAAAQAPSGANKQPWTFVLVTDREIRRRIREAAEGAERAFYEERAPDRWLSDLQPLGTDWRKPFLETAPALIAVFSQATGSDESQHYYVKESVGIACGFLLAALHLAGIATLTHTPTPMAFLSEILRRPPNERPYMLIPVGYPADGCRVPALRRKALAEVLIEL